MILKRGVTGFTGGDLSLDRDWVGRVKIFKKHCYQIAHQLKGEVTNWYDPDVSIGYAHAQVNIDGQHLYIFHNSMYDYIAFTTNRLITGLEFIDHVQLAALFAQHYTVLTVAQLAEPLRRQAKGVGHILLNENDLNDVELYYMDYFSAQTVGDLVFNYWD